MPIRKKHVSRLVAALMGLTVLGPLVVLAWWAIWLRGQGPAGELRDRLETRLRCRAELTGHRPVGLEAARLDGLDLRWDLGTGEVAVRLSNVRAERDRSGRWGLAADSGSLTVEADRLRPTMAAWSQRLVQLGDEAVPLGPIDVATLTVKVESECLRLAESGWARVRAHAEDGLEAEFETSPGGEMGTSGPRLQARVRLHPRSASGVFGGLSAKAWHLTPADVVRAVPGWPARTEAGGRVEVHYVWVPAPEPSAPQGETLEVTATGLDLAPLTTNLPGGPITGLAKANVEWLPVAPGPAERGLVVSVSAAGEGLVSGETLRWIEGLGPAFEGYGEMVGGRIGYEWFVLDVRVGPNGRAHIPRWRGDKSDLLFTRLFGEEVPLLWVTADTFDVSPVWEQLRPVLVGSPDEPAEP